MEFKLSFFCAMDEILSVLCKENYFSEINIHECFQSLLWGHDQIL